MGGVEKAGELSPWVVTVGLDLSIEGRGGGGGIMPFSIVWGFVDSCLACGRVGKAGRCSPVT